MGESFEFEHVDFITAGALGPPGQRTFYIQVEVDERRVSLVAEKAQIRSLAHLAQELLGRAGVSVMPDDLDETAQRLREPVDPAWRAGSISLGMDEDGGRFLLEVEELPSGEDSGQLPGDEEIPTEDLSEGFEPDEEPALARVWLTQDQLAAMAAHAAYAVEAGARETCRLCGRPIDPGGHICPSMNGHGPLSS